ncbi:hypothetical protein [Lyngbya confervoides]|uniref:Uncharacterized protein n=1 Tax=Lyngbya confervoides BDU141951 TaxID=1574623 RepID=A0ABD4T5R4_9CYAN|nr:hypothetical protein [Lyngbya confervoides]MCM1983828.1 hypothetical protein [Lyngbya confervoides BDU141951]
MMNSQDVNPVACSHKGEADLIAGISWFYAHFITGDIDEHEFSDLVDLHIELNHAAA